MTEESKPADIVEFPPLPDAAIRELGWMPSIATAAQIKAMAIELQRLRRTGAPAESRQSRQPVPSPSPEAMEAAKQILAAEAKYENAPRTKTGSTWRTYAAAVGFLGPIVARALLSRAALSTPEDRT